MCKPAYINYMVTTDQKLIIDTCTKRGKNPSTTLKVVLMHKGRGQEERTIEKWLEQPEDI